MFVVKIVKQKQLKRKPKFLIFFFRNGRKLKFLGRYNFFHKKIKSLNFDLSFFLSHVLHSNFDVKDRVFKVLYKVLMSSRFV